MSWWGKSKPAHHLPPLPEHAGAHKPDHKPEHKPAHKTDTAHKPSRPEQKPAQKPVQVPTSAPKEAPKMDVHAPAKLEPKPEQKAEHKPAPEAKPAKPAKAAKTDKPRKRLQRRSLGEYLEKAGYETDADALKRKVKIGIIVLFILVTIGSLIVAVVGGAEPIDILLFLIALWTAILGAVYLVIWGIIYFFLDYRIYLRTQELEDVLPDYLQLASSNIAAGMPIDRALWYAIRPNFGVLAKEMEDVAKATMAGEDLEVSLQRFSSKYDSTVLKRSINILVEGLNAGGEMADLLNKIALNIEEMKIMKKEMASSVTTYAIFITFASVVIAPILFALATELLGIIIKITGSLDTGGSSMINLGSPDPAAVDNFKTFSILMTIVTTTFSAALVSVIKKGNVIDGIKTIPVYALVALGIYWVASTVLHSLLGGIL